ncbi:MAG: hypothetical protein H0U92_01860 [Actinobacteria bacterium]|nr:hypothetical protein [Actinomycetota bacterium]
MCVQGCLVSFRPIEILGEVHRRPAQKHDAIVLPGVADKRRVSGLEHVRRRMPDRCFPVSVVSAEAVGDICELGPREDRGLRQLVLPKNIHVGDRRRESPA